MTEDSSLNLKELVDDLPVPPKIDEDIQQLEALIGNLKAEDLEEYEHVSKIHDVAQGLADQLRDLRFRGSVGSKTQIIPHIIKAIKKIITFSLGSKNRVSTSRIRALRQLLRIIGNLVHTADHNRRQYLESDGAQALKFTMDSLLELEHVQVGMCEEEIQIAILVATNLTIDYQPAAVALAEINLTATLSAIIEYAYSKRLKWMSLPLILLEELVAIEAGWTRIPESLLCTLSKMILYYASEVDTDNISQNESDPNAQLLMICSYLLETIVEHASSFRFTGWLFTHSDPSKFSFSSDPPVQMWMKLSMFLRHRHFKTEAVPSTSHGNDLPTIFSLVNAHIIRAIVVAVAYSHLTLACSISMMNMLVDWIEDPAVLEDRPDLVIMAGLWLGNIACDDKSCRLLVQDYGILESLIRIFRKWTPSSIEPKDDSSLAKFQPGQQVQVLHAWCGLARNLAVADTYKSRLGDLGLVTYALECFRPEFDIVAPLNGTAAALLRHLCRNHPDNVKRVLETDRIRSVINVCLRAEEPYLILESSRLLSVLTNTATKIHQSESKAIGDELEILYSEATVDALVRFAYVSVISHQLVLVNEALISLALLAVRPELFHSLCSNLLKVRDPTGPSPSASEPLSLGEENDPPQESPNKNKKTYKNALDALLSIWIPVSDAKEKDPDPPETGDDDLSTVVQESLASDGVSSTRTLLELLTDEVSQSSEADQDQNQKLPGPKQTPIQIKENLKVVLIQLGNQSIHNKPILTRGGNLVNNNHEKCDDDAEGNKHDEDSESDKRDEGIQEIRKSLINHYNSFHIKNQQLSDQQSNGLDQQKPTQEEKKINAYNEEHDSKNSTTINRTDVDAIVCKNGVAETASNQNNNTSNSGGEKGNENGLDKRDQIISLDPSSFSIVEVLQAWNVQSKISS